MTADSFTLDHVLAPITPEAFFAEVFEKKHLVVKRQDPGYFRDLLSFADIDHVVSTMGLYAPEITVTRNTGHNHGQSGTDSDTDSGAPKATDHDSDAPPATDVDAGAGASVGATEYTFESGYVDPVRVGQLFADGSTVILSGLHERLPKLARYARALEAAMSCRVQTNIYMTPAQNQGFRPHYDSHDVLVLQIEGTKEWRIYDTPVELPLNEQGFTPGEVPIGPETDRFVLEPGDVAYVPRGLAHDAVATDQTSVHITTGLMFRTYADLVVEAARIIAHKDPAFRRALPPGFAAQGFDLDGQEPVLRGLLKTLAETAPCRALLDDFRTDFIGSRLPRVEGQLAQAAKAETLTPQTRVGARPDLVYALDRLDGSDGKAPQVVLSCHGAEIILPDHAETPLRHALTHADFRVADLPGSLDDAGKLVLVRRLIREGLVQVH